MQKQFYIGADIGGTHMRTALVDRQGNIVEVQKIPTDISLGPQQAGRRLAEQCRRLVARSIQLSGDVVSIGLGVAGKIDAGRGRVIFSPNLPPMKNYPLATELQDQIELPVFMENDANVFGLGEQWLGAAGAMQNWIGITLGTGVGGCLFLGSRLWNGDGLGFSGEIGHMIIDADGPVCACGMRGCLEAHASARALTEGARQGVTGGTQAGSRLAQLCSTRTLTAKDVYQEAVGGDSTAIKLFQRMGWALGLAIGNLFTFLGIRHAIIGGGVSDAWDLFIQPLRKSLAEHCCMLQESLMIILPSRLGDNAALLGAARFAMEAMVRGKRVPGN